MSEVLNRPNMDAIRLICNAIDEAGLDYATLDALQVMIEARSLRAKVDFEGRSKVTLTMLLHRMIARNIVTEDEADSMRTAIRKLNWFLDRPATLNDLTTATLGNFYIDKNFEPTRKAIKDSIQCLVRYAVKARLIDERQVRELLDAQRLLRL
jgi:hypothetical protein